VSDLACIVDVQRKGEDRDVMGASDLTDRHYCCNSDWGENSVQGICQAELY